MKILLYFLSVQDKPEDVFMNTFVWRSSKRQTSGIRQLQASDGWVGGFSDDYQTLKRWKRRKEEKEVKEDPARKKNTTVTGEFLEEALIFENKVAKRTYSDVGRS
ncbi:hypothetical protein HHI36_014007 [Cryptolaemus montrouzieri]|uniref:Uncharacterized protein n=1 Tax=Cryptolaemus montrouzieri TaxID=559131 RepID=A0ABD2N1H3_9CUCU